MSEDKAKLEEKIKRASQLLFLRRHRNPGIGEWELRRVIGSDYRAVLKALDEKLDPLGLTVKEVEHEGKPRFLVTIKGNPPLELEPSLGWMRVDSLAGLAMALAFLTAHGGRAPPAEVESFLESKFPKRRARSLLTGFLEEGYLELGKGGAYEIGWRTKAEIDLAELARRIISSAPRTASSENPSQPP
ncbi:MAG TPA: hypothetical protein ENO31_02325 [Thermoprotei archaeon]|nr:hypothetical protein [TACK group archaeon]HEV51356.1 hypothetical protein [Thermoprotei archaeon]